MYEYNCELVRVIDGDTIVLDIDAGFSITVRKHVRVLGIDTPEMRGPERTAGLEATMKVTRWLAGRQLTVFTEKADSFGRYLGDIFGNGESLTDWLLGMGYDPY